jgi:hypothetical protein
MYKHAHGVYGSLKNTMDQQRQVFDEPHEKLIAILILIVAYSFIYYSLYLRDPIHFNFDSSKYKNTSLNINYGHFLWYSCMLNFTMPLGDIYPQSPVSKAITVSQAGMFWLVMLS